MDPVCRGEGVVGMGAVGAKGKGWLRLGAAHELKSGRQKKGGNRHLASWGDRRGSGSGQKCMG